MQWEIFFRNTRTDFGPEVLGGITEPVDAACSLCNAYCAGETREFLSEVFKITDIVPDRSG